MKNIFANRDSDFYPGVINLTEYPIVVYEERGVIFNKTVLLPNEAVNIKARETGPFFYGLHALIGDRLPDTWDSFKSFVGASIVPIYFIGTMIAATLSAGILIGPALALAPLITGIAVNGVVIDAALVIIGIKAAGGAVPVAKYLVESHESYFHVNRPHNAFRERYLAVRGGLIRDLYFEDINAETFFEKMQGQAIRCNP